MQIGSRAADWGRVLIVAAAAAAPGLAVLAWLASAGFLAAHLALSGGAVVLGLTALLLAGPVLAFAALRDAVADLATGAAGPLRSADQIRLAIQRLAREWRGRSQQAEARVAAADAVVAAIPDPVIVLDARRRIVRANTAAAALIGPAGPARDLASALRNPAVLTAADAVLAGVAAKTVDFAVSIPYDRQLRARLARIAAPAPDRAAALLILHDITELKRAEQMRADFIANASHELRTPLAALSGFIETLLGPARDDAEARERFLATMSAEAARMGRVVEALLSLSRIELNEHVLPRDRVALSDVLRQSADALELRAGERGMRIALAVASDLPDVRGDRDELIQLFQNLLDNAIKYAGAGSEITIVAEVSGDFVAVSVRDRGDGIAREHLPRLTERFYRVDKARAGEMNGTGLGLAIVKHIVARHRGSLDIASTPGEGSAFTVRLPRYAGNRPS